MWTWRISFLPFTTAIVLSIATTRRKSYLRWRWNSDAARSLNRPPRWMMSFNNPRHHRCHRIHKPIVEEKSTKCDVFHVTITIWRPKNDQDSWSLLSRQIVIREPRGLRLNLSRLRNDAIPQSSLITSLKYLECLSNHKKSYLLYGSRSLHYSNRLPNYISL